MKRKIRTDEPGHERDQPTNETDRGLSDVVAFVLTFGIIITSMAVVSTAGIDQLSQLRDAEQIESAERSMQVAAGEIDHLRDGDPFRVLEFSLNDGDLWFNRSSSIYLHAQTDSGDVLLDGTFNVSSLEHRFDRPSGDLTIAYESGAVIRSDAAVPSFEPEWYVDQNSAIITLVNLSAEGSIDAAGGYHSDVVIGPNRNIPQGAPATDPDETTQIRSERNLSEDTMLVNEHLDGSTATVTVDISGTANPDQWRRYLNQTGWETAGTQYTLRTEKDITERVLVRQVTVTLS